MATATTVWTENGDGGLWHWGAPYQRGGSETLCAGITLGWIRDVEWIREVHGPSEQISYLPAHMVDGSARRGNAIGRVVDVEGW